MRCATNVEKISKKLCEERLEAGEGKPIYQAQGFVRQLPPQHGWIDVLCLRHTTAFPHPDIRSISAHYLHDTELARRQFTNCWNGDQSSYDRRIGALLKGFDMVLKVSLQEQGSCVALSVHKSTCVSAICCCCRMGRSRSTCSGTQTLGQGCTTSTACWSA